MKAKHMVMLVAVLLVVAAGLFAALKLRAAAGVSAAAGAERRGDHAAALTRYVDAFYRAVPGKAVPDVNRSKVFKPPVWKKALEDHVAWISGTGTGAAQRDTLLDAVTRNAARVRADNFVTGESRKELAPAQYVALWNSAFFATGITPDTAHRALAESCFANKISFVKITARTSFTYEVSLMDTVTGRRVTFSVFPESSTHILVRPGAHILLCRSSFKPGPGQIWHSTPTLIPLTVPASPSLYSFTLATRVVREKER